VLVLAAPGMAVIVGFVGLVVDVGLYMVERRQLQNAADAAALAGAADLLDAAVATSASLEWAGLNGYAAGEDVTIAINTPYQGEPDKIEVVITRRQSSRILGILGVDDADVKA
jgi:uncharacterized membrane protein